jgi:hypothetical protein
MNNLKFQAFILSKEIPVSAHGKSESFSIQIKLSVTGKYGTLQLAYLAHSTGPIQGLIEIYLVIM